MSSKYVLTKDTAVEISSASAASLADATSATFVGISCITTEFQYQGGQKQDVDVTTFCSMESENGDGLAAQAEISFSGHFVPTDEGQQSIESAYEDSTRRLLRISFADGTSETYLVSVRQFSFSGQVNNKWTNSLNLRVFAKERKLPTP